MFIGTALCHTSRYNAILMLWVLDFRDVLRFDTFLHVTPMILGIHLPCYLVNTLWKFYHIFFHSLNKWFFDVCKQRKKMLHKILKSLPWIERQSIYLWLRASWELNNHLIGHVETWKRKSTGVTRGCAKYFIVKPQIDLKGFNCSRASFSTPAQSHGDKIISTRFS